MFVLVEYFIILFLFILKYYYIIKLSFSYKRFVNEYSSFLLLIMIIDILLFFPWVVHVLGLKNHSIFEIFTKLILDLVFNV